MAEYTIYHVLPKDDQWTVKKEKAERASFIMDTKQEAKEKARELAKDDNTTVVIHRKDGTVEEIMNPRA